ncbi:Uncharacterised protein [Burkholderia pseudomallei]|uniref:hypothetical protein n=1 Tax=Burkholderia pseudomallei TaxID=28450 RepID=UPI000F0620E3|nr:hypothetical protein [Burkholderia pseudomallei]CAJ5369694.1 Uncharacterised protein [Burkholderia pseudomallei]CAJ5623459.1 Uncharacterised protein [Burkholderia pseudomallei]CAJ9343850.1 Uncharacterised protein [Burkholderia pseudomallei]CAK0493762.1 Uncharacterised protein [Burkholderia pseudomallei]VBN64257.1 Uncharacterised protein [Burkholderia pseudomallei]
MRTHRRLHIPRSLMVVLAMLAALMVVANVVHVIGMRLVGSVVAWQRCLHAHAWMFGFWRLGLYAAIMRGWWWMRTRVRQHENSPESRRRLMRAEIAAALAIVLTEIIAMWSPL